MSETESRELTTEAEPTPGNTLAMIARAASDPHVDVAKMQALMTMHERAQDRLAKQLFNEAFLRLQKVLPSISKTGAIKNNSGQVQSRYAKWEVLYRTIKPLLDAENFTLTFRNGSDAKGILTVEAILLHGGGHSESSGPMPLPLDTTGNKNGVQGMGSSMSYGKRYSTIALLNIVTEDDTDGRGPQQATIEDSDEAMRLVFEEAKSVAESDGLVAYDAHFRHLPRQAKLWLVNTKVEGGNDTLHDQLKKMAAESDRLANSKGS